MHLSQCLTSPFRSKLSCPYTQVYTFPASGRYTIYWGIKTLMTLKSVNSYCWYITIDWLFGHVRAHYGIFGRNYLSIPKLQRFNAHAHCGMFGYMPLITHAFKQSGRIWSNTNYIVNCHYLWASRTSLHYRCWAHVSKSTIKKYSTHLWTIGTE